MSTTAWLPPIVIPSYNRSSPVSLNTLDSKISAPLPSTWACSSNIIGLAKLYYMGSPVRVYFIPAPRVWIVGLLPDSIHLPTNPKAIFSLPEMSYPEITNLHSVYLKIIGELIYLAVNTCPDISYIINALAQHNTQPEMHHYTVAKCILCYLAGMLNLCLCYQSDADNKQLFIYANAS